jgi:hydrogenase expression/formation protein HypC
VCLALPARVIELDEDGAAGTVELGGVRRRVSCALLDEVAVGDHVIVHVGYALVRLDTAEAEAAITELTALAAHHAAAELRSSDGAPPDDEQGPA